MNKPPTLSHFIDGIFEITELTPEDYSLLTKNTIKAVAKEWLNYLRSLEKDSKGKDKSISGGITFIKHFFELEEEEITNDC